MQKLLAVAALAGSLVLLSVSSACDKSPTAPGGSSNGSSTARLEISGPDTIAPGAQAQYTITAFLQSGARQGPVNASWRTSNPAVATIDPSGRATGQGNGEAVVTASFAGTSSSKGIMVLPQGTFRLKGRVIDESTNQDVRSADVRLRTASGSEMRTTTSPTGEFVFYGVPADTELEITSTGYSPHTEVLQLREHATVQIRLKRDASVPQVAGAYTLTVTAGTCGPVSGPPQLRSDLRSRTYGAVVTQTATTMAVALSNAEFFRGPGKTSNSFTGFVDRGRLNLYLYGPDNYYYEYYLPFFVSDVIERLPDGTFLITSGSGPLTATGDGFRATLTGGLWHRETVPNGTILGLCTTQVSLDFTR